MAKKKVVVTFHDIEKCGYYTWTGKKPAVGGLEQTLADLKAWSDGKSISLTRLENSKGRQENMPIYLVGVDKVGDDWTLATWNEVPAGDGGVASVAMNSVVGGEPKVFVSEVEEDSIPGYATYFWIVPEHNVLATLRMEASVAGKEAMRAYIEAFLYRESRCVVQDEEGEIIGYRSPDDVDGEVLSLHPKFRLNIFSKSGKLDEIRRNVHRIVKVIRSGNLDAVNKVDQVIYQGVLGFLRGANKKRKVVADSRLKVSLEMTPTIEELNNMIAEELMAEHTTAWDDLGFVFEKDKEIHWVGKSLARDTFEMDLEVNEAGVVSLASLKAELANRRTYLLRMLN